MNCNTQNAKIETINEKTLVVGIDVVTVQTIVKTDEI